MGKTKKHKGGKKVARANGRAVICIAPSEKVEETFFYETWAPKIQDEITKAGLNLQKEQILYKLFKTFKV